MFAILNLIHWSRSNFNGDCALSLSGPVRYSPRRIRLVGANTFLIIFHPFEFTSGSGSTDVIFFFRLPLHEFQLLSLLNRNQSHHEPRKSGERRARLPLSKLFSILLSSHFLYGSMHTSNILMVSINLLLTLKVFIKKKALLLYISFSTM